MGCFQDVSDFFISLYLPPSPFDQFHLGDEVESEEAPSLFASTTRGAQFWERFQTVSDDIIPPYIFLWDIKKEEEGQRSLFGKIQKVGRKRERAWTKEEMHPEV